MGYHNPQQFSNLRIITSTQLTWCYLSLPLCPASKAQLLTHQARPVEAHQEQMDKLLETFPGYLRRWQKTKRNPNGTSQVVPRQYRFSGEHLGSLPTLQRRAFPSPLTMVETQQHSRSGWRRAPQLFTPQKVGSPGTFIHLGLQTASAKRTTYTCSSGCKGQAGHLPRRAETQTNVGEEIEKKIFFFFFPCITSSQSRASRGKAIPLQARTSHPHPRDLPAQPGAGRERSSQSHLPAPPHHWPHIRHGSPFPKMHLLDKTLSSPTPRWLFPTQLLPTKKLLLHQVAAKDPERSFNLQNSQGVGGRGTSWNSLLAQQLTHLHGAEARTTQLSPQTHTLPHQATGKEKKTKIPGWA